MNEVAGDVIDITPEMHMQPNPGLEIYRVEMIDAKGNVTSTLSMDEKFSVNFITGFMTNRKKYRVGIVLQSPRCGAAGDLRQHRGQPTAPEGQTGPELPADGAVRQCVPAGAYMMDLVVKNQGNASIDQVRGIPFYVAAVSAENSDKIVLGGYFNIRHEWQDPIEIG